MASKSSDEEGEILPKCVADYYFVDFKDEPVSFSILPLQWSTDDENPDGLKMMIYVRGSAHGGLQKIHKRVIAWKFDISGAEPEISVLSKDRYWIELQRPRKCFQNFVRAVLITISWLHFVKKNPDGSGTSPWNHLLKTFGTYEPEPSVNDLLVNTPLIREAVKRDEDLSESKFILPYLKVKIGSCGETYIKEKIGSRGKTYLKKKIGSRGETAVFEFKDLDTMRGYVSLDDGDDNVESEENDEDKDNLFDTVCSICDNGGEVLW